MNNYRIHSSRRVFYETNIEAESEQEALKLFRFCDLHNFDEAGENDFDNAGEIEIDSIHLIVKEN
jgi:hypothetical protein